MDTDLFIIVLQYLIEQYGSRRIDQDVIDRIVTCGKEIEMTYRSCEPRNDNDPQKNKENGRDG